MTCRTCKTFVTSHFFRRLGLLLQCLVCLFQGSNLGERLLKFACYPVGFVATLLQDPLKFLVSLQRCSLLRLGLHFFRVAVSAGEAVALAQAATFSDTSS